MSLKYEPSWESQSSCSWQINLSMADYGLHRVHAQVLSGVLMTLVRCTAPFRGRRGSTSHAQLHL